MKKLFYLISLCLLIAHAHAQFPYRTKASGNWSTLATWERFNGSSWIEPTPAEGYPGEIVPAGSVTLEGGFAVTVTGTVPNPISSLTIGDGVNVVENLSFASAGSAGYNISIAGDLAFNLGSLSVINAVGQNEHRLAIGGNVSSNNQFSISAFSVDDFVTVSLVGSADQTIAGGSAMNFTSLEIAKPGGNTLLANDVHVLVRASFIQGIVYSTSTNMFHFETNSIVAAANDNSFIDGPVSRNGNTDFGFPVGAAGFGLHPIFIGSTSMPSTYEALYIRASAYTKGPVDPGSGLVNVSNCEHWSLNKVSGDDADVGVSWTPMSRCNVYEYVEQVSDLRVALFDGTNWDEAPGSGYDYTYPGPPPAASTPALGAARRIGVNAFGFFALANVNATLNPLPVKFLSLNAVAQSQGNLVKWETSNESNLNGYELQRSPDGKNFVTINQQPAANRIQKNSYSYLDAGANSPTSYYRVRSIDVDGELNYSPIVKLGGTKPGSTFTVFPNPVRGRSIIIQTQSLSGGNYELRLVNSLGQGVHSQLISHVGGALNLGVHLPASLSRGIYHLQLVSPENRLSKMILIE